MKLKQYRTRTTELWKKVTSVRSPDDLYLLWKLRHSRAADQTGKPVVLRPRALDGMPVLCRPGTTDVSTFFATFAAKYHVPLERLDRPQCIVDLGANVGYTTAHFAHLYSGARIFAVELEYGNYALACRNVSPWGDRVQVIHAGAWSCDGTATLAGEHANAFRIRRENEASDNDQHLVQEHDHIPVVRTMSMTTLLASNSIAHIDFLKMDIEGAEREILLEQEPSWLNVVDELNLEIHRRDDRSRYVRVLQEHGFDQVGRSNHWCAVRARRRHSTVRPVSVP